MRNRASILQSPRNIVNAGKEASEETASHDNL
jgi:hypothetical protein